MCTFCQPVYYHHLSINPPSPKPTQRTPARLQARAFLAPLPVRALPGVGAKAEVRRQQAAAPV